MKQDVDFPTHIQGNCLDLILTHEDSSIVKSTVISDLITDHFTIIYKLKMCKVDASSSIVYYRNIKSIDLDLFISVISEYISIHDNIDISYLNNTLLKVLDTFAPLKNLIFPSPIFSLV